MASDPLKMEKKKEKNHVLKSICTINKKNGSNIKYRKMIKQ